MLRSSSIIGLFIGSLLVLALLAGTYAIERDQVTEELSERNRQRIISVSDSLEEHLSNMLERIKIVSSIPSLASFLDDPSETNRERLSSDLQVFAEYSYDLEQLRVLDRDGMELVRMNTYGIPVPKDELQDKSGRYYFREVINMRSDGVYLSPLDLNVEQGVVERPFRPTIRLAMPLQNSENERVGVLVMNINASKMLHSMDGLSSEITARLHLVNEGGHWLVHENMDQYGWGFMFPELNHINLAQLKPDLWEQMLATPFGRTMYNENEFYEWKRLLPYEMIRRTSGFEIQDLHNQWTVILYYDEAAYAALFESLNRRYLYVLAAIVLIVISSWIVMLFRMASRRDVSRLKALHEQVLTSAELAVISTDLEGRIVFSNQAVKNLAGWAPNDLVDRQSVIDLLEAFEIDARARAFDEGRCDSESPGMEHIAHAVEVHGRYVEEWTMSCKDGIKIPVLMAVSSLRDDSGAVNGFLFVLVDIREQKSAQLALLEATKAAEAHAAAKSQFLANMSHEIRTPMNGVIGVASLLENSDLDSSQLKLVRTLLRSGDLLLNVINDILDYSKIEAGSMTIEQEPFDLHDLVENVLYLYAPSAADRMVELINQLDPKLHDCFIGDSHRITQVLANLVGNAVKFTEKGEVALKAFEAESNDDQSKIVFQVRDTGIGMNEETQQAIFEPFQQADSGTTRKFGGTGLGLAIATNLVDLMGGSIRVQSELGVGTTFTVELVLERGKATGKRPSARGQFEGKRAICIDDNATNLYVLEGQLELLGFEVETYEDPMQAYRMIANHGACYDLIVLDHQMPIMDGVELARNLLPFRIHDGMSTPCIMLSSSDSQLSRDLRTELKIDGMMLKPASLYSLERVLRSVLPQDSVPDRAAPDGDTVKKETGLSELRKGLRIIFADDDAVNRLVMDNQLKHLGLEADIVESGSELIDQLDEKAYNVVLLDCNMPDLDGYEVARTIRKKETEGRYTASGKRIWIIASTAYAFESEQDKAYQAGMDDYLTKPTKESDLAAVLARVPEEYFTS